MDLNAISQNNYLVNPSFDDELKELNEKLEEVKSNIEASVNKIARYVGLDKKNIKLEYSSQNGYCYRVTMKDEKVLRKKDGIFFVDSTKAGVRFRNSDLEEMNKEYLHTNAAYIKQQQYVVSEIMICATGEEWIWLFSSSGFCIPDLEPPWQIQ